MPQEVKFVDKGSPDIAHGRWGVSITEANKLINLHIPISPNAVEYENCKPPGVFLTFTVTFLQ